MRRKIALFITALILNISIMTAYCIPAQASAAGGIANGLYETFSRIFGYSWGVYKSTDEMGYNYTMSNMQDFWDHQVKGEPYFWEDQKEIPPLLIKENMLAFLNDALFNINQYNAGEYMWEFFDGLNVMSYNATRTLVTKNIEAKLVEAIGTINELTDSEYQTAFERTNELLFNPNVAGADSNLQLHYQIFEAVMNGLVVNSSYDENSMWFSPIVDSAFDICNLTRQEYVKDGYTLYIYQGNSFIYKTTSNEMCHIDYDKKVFFIPYFNTLSYMFEMRAVCDEPFTIHKTRYSSSGSKNFDEISQSSRYKDGVYSYGFAWEEWKSSSLEIGRYGKNSSNLYPSLYDHIAGTYFGMDLALENGESISEIAPSVDLALDAFWNKDITTEDVVNLADNLAGVQDAAGTEEALDVLTNTIAGLVTTLPDAIVDGKNDVVTAVDGLGEVILTLPKAIWKEFAGVLEDIQTKVGTQAQTKPWEGDLDENSPDILPIFNCLIILLQIIIALLKIFIHCLQFIINIFAIPPSSAMLPEEMILGLEYINTIEIPFLGMSVYSFMMGLIYIMIVFSAIRILRVNVDRIKIPKKLNGGL